MRNVELLQATMQYIVDYPEEHDQTVFICGTAACFAGRAALLSNWTYQDVMSKSISSNQMYDAGAELLGLTILEAARLFDADNTAAMLELMVKDLVNGDEMRQPSQYRNEMPS